MAKVWGGIVSLGLLMAVLAACGGGGGGGQVEAEPVVFAQLQNTYAFADTDGEQLLVHSYLEEVPELAALDVAIGPDGQYLPIEYVGEQTSKEGDSYRAVAENLANMGGYLYRVTQGQAEANATYFLTSSQVVKPEQVLVPGNQEFPELEAKVVKEIADLRQMPVEEGWLLADYGGGRQLLQVVLAPAGEVKVLAIIYADGDGNFRSMDFPASGDEYSAWRVDDGGETRPEDFVVGFATLTDQGFMVTLSWWGPEGESTFVLREEGDALVTTALEAYRYWSPM